MPEEKKKGRNTSTGLMLEGTIIPALERGGYAVERQVHVGTRLGKPGKHMVDAVANKDNEEFLVSSKWQQTSGTAEEKVPYEVMCLADAILLGNGKYKKAYIVLGGDKWSLRVFYTSGKFKDFFKNAENVHIVTLERFLAMANRAEL